MRDPTKKRCSFFCVPPEGFLAIGYGSKLFIYPQTTHRDTLSTKNLEGFGPLVMVNEYLEVEDFHSDQNPNVIYKGNLVPKSTKSMKFA